MSLYAFWVIRLNVRIEVYFEKLANGAKSGNLDNFSEYFLDIGCNSRHIGKIASKKNFIAVGLNIDKNVISFDGLYVIGVSEFLPFKKKCFDFMACISVLENCNNLDKLMEEMVRVLKPKGKIYLYFPNFLFPNEHSELPVTSIPNHLVKPYLEIAKNFRKRFDSTYITHINYIFVYSIKQKFENLGTKVTIFFEGEELRHLLTKVGILGGAWIVVERSKTNII